MVIRNESWNNVSERFSALWDSKNTISDEKIFLKYVDSLTLKGNQIINAVSAYGTPQYLLDEDALISDAKSFSETFLTYNKNMKFFYAFKCNDLPAIIRILKNNNFNADVASLFELKLALKLGFTDIIFTSPGKTDEELLLAMKNSSKTIINIDNVEEISRIIVLLEKNFYNNKNILIRISFRVNVLQGLWDKFGISLNDLKKATNIVEKHSFLQWVGIHFHSSWNETPEKHLESLKKLHLYLSKNYSVKELKKLKFIDIGGGFTPEGNAQLFNDTDKGAMMQLLYPEGSKDYDMKTFRRPCKNNYVAIEEFASKICGLFDKLFVKDLGLNLELWVEPGRMLISKSTHIVLKVLAVKDNNVIVEGGINMIGGYDADHTAFPIINISKPSNKYNDSVVYGPLCDPNDLWGYGYYGEKASVGDIIVVMHQGAYTYATAWKFIKPISKYVGFKKNNVRILKDEETFEDRYRACKF